MIKCEHIETFGFEAAVRGMRNPWDSWEKSDSIMCHGYDSECPMADKGYEPVICDNKDVNCDRYCIGKKDMKLMRKLFVGGAVHRKYLRMIHIQMDVTAPLFWWKEYDTYKVGTTANSCSTMHTLTKRTLTAEDFSFDRTPRDFYEDIIDNLNCLIGFYNDYDQFVKDQKEMGFCLNEIATKEDIWRNIIELLPTSFNQKRTIDLDYETAYNIIRWRKDHKLKEWREFVKVLESLPYVKEIAVVEE